MFGRLNKIEYKEYVKYVLVERLESVRTHSADDEEFKKNMREYILEFGKSL